MNRLRLESVRERYNSLDMKDKCELMRKVSLLSIERLKSNVVSVKALQQISEGDESVLEVFGACLLYGSEAVFRDKEEGAEHV